MSDETIKDGKLNTGSRMYRIAACLDACDGVATDDLTPGCVAKLRSEREKYENTVQAMLQLMRERDARDATIAALNLRLVECGHREARLREALMKIHREPHSADTAIVGILVLREWAKEALTTESEATDSPGKAIECVRYGGTHLCNRCHRIVANDGHDCEPLPDMSGYPADHLEPVHSPTKPVHCDPMAETQATEATDPWIALYREHVKPDDVPEWAECLGIDDNGRIEAFSFRPNYGRFGWRGHMKRAVIATAAFTGRRRESVHRVKDIWPELRKGGGS